MSCPKRRRFSGFALTVAPERRQPVGMEQWPFEWCFQAASAAVFLLSREDARAGHIRHLLADDKPTPFRIFPSSQLPCRTATFHQAPLVAP